MKIKKFSFLFFLFFCVLHSQFFQSYIPFFYYLNIYFISIIIFIFNAFPKLKKDVFYLIICLIFVFVYFVYRYSLIDSEFFQISIKSLQFNFGYLFIIPLLLTLRKKIDIKNFISVAFYFFSIEIIIEYLIYITLGLSPLIFKHIPESYIFDSGSSIISISRSIGISGNSSVSGVQLVVLFLFKQSFNNHKSFKEILNIDLLIFLLSFIMIFSGSAFFSLLFGILIMYFFKLNILKKIFISIPLTLIFLFAINNINIYEPSGNKFSINYLFYLLMDTENYTSFLPQFSIFISEYGFEKILFGNYIIPWGKNIEDVFVTVDYAYLNLLFEFGVIGVAFFIFIIVLIFKKLKKYISYYENSNSFFIDLSLLVLLISNLHYPVISYYYTQSLICIFLFALFNNYHLNLKNES